MTLLKKNNEKYNCYLVSVNSNVTVDQIAQFLMYEVGIHIPINSGGRYSGWKGNVRPVITFRSCA